MKQMDTEQNYKEQTEFFDFFDSMWDRNESTEETLPQEIESIEKTRIKNALDHTNGNRTQAAKMLGIGRTNLIAKMKKYSITYSEDS